ncbi:hypothetical protein Tco_1502404 [Tanacetum coccineum]
MDENTVHLWLKDHQDAAEKLVWQQAEAFQLQLDTLRVELQATRGLFQNQQGGGGDQALLLPRSVHLDVSKFSRNDLDRWILAITEYFSLLNTPADQCLRIMGFNLEGVAAEWFQWMSRNGLITTWDMFVESVKSRFGPSKYEDPQGDLSKLLQLVARVGPLSGKDPLVIVVADTDCLPHVYGGSSLSAHVLKHIDRSQLVSGLSGSSIADIKYVLTQKGLDTLCQTFHIPDDVHPQLPSPNQTIHEMPTGKIAAKVSHFEILCRVHGIEPTVGLFRCFYVNSKNKGWVSFSKRPDSDVVCYTKPLDSLKRWNDHFFCVDSFACPASFSWHTDKNVSRDPFPKSTEFSADDYALFVAHSAQFRKFPEPFLCLIGMSRNYTLDEDTYPTFPRDDGTGGCLW